MVLLSTVRLRQPNSTLMVDLVSKLNSFRRNRERRLDFPTAESPIRITVSKASIEFHDLVRFSSLCCFSVCILTSILLYKKSYSGEADMMGKRVFFFFIHQDLRCVREKSEKKDTLTLYLTRRHFLRQG